MFFPLAITFLAACGGDTSGPGNNVTGSWLYSVSNLTSGSLTCSSSGTTLSITQSSSSFSGSYAGGTLTCLTPSGSSSVAIGGGAVVSGSISGSNVSFDLDTGDWHNTGTINGGSMSGTVTVQLVISGTTYVLSGNFGAARS
jgi:hypothetical protein